MKVLFVYPKSNPLISRHVSMLTDGLQQSVSVGTADSVSAIRKAVKEQEPDIIHCHGCPSVSAARAILSGINKGSRLVLTLHGQMEPWATDKNKKVPAGFWHKKLITRAYSVILLGRLELTNFQKLGWNRRTEEIHNAVTTNTISRQEMCTATFAVYQKVMDSNTLELMDEPTIRMLRAVVKVGIMGDRRWTVVLPSEEVNWRHLLLYAEHENIRNYVDYGISILGLSVPAIDTSRIAAYFPDKYETPRPIREKVGEYTGNETDYLVRIIHQIRNSTKYVSYKDLKKLMLDLKKVYAAPDEQTALANLEEFGEKWDTKYPKISKSWSEHWPSLATYFKYPESVRRLIYTTNTIEGFNRQLRKVTKSKTIFPSDDSLLKMLYLAMIDITKKWTGHRQDWGEIHSQLEIYFEERLEGHRY